MFGEHALYEYCSLSHAQVEGELLLAPGFVVPPLLDFSGYQQYINEMLPSETPYLYGLHPNAEIEFLTTTANDLFRTVFEMQPRDAGAGSGGGMSKEEVIKGILDDLTERMPEAFLMVELLAKIPAEERTPFVIVAIQVSWTKHETQGVPTTSLFRVATGG